MSEARDRTHPRVEPAQLGFGRLFDRTTDAVVVADEGGNVVLWNPAATRLFGYAPGETPCLNVRELVPPELRDAHDRGIARFRERGRGALIDSGRPFELPALRRDGARIMIEMTLSRIDEPKGYVMAILRDVTDRVLLQREAERDREALRQMNEGLEAFAYVVSHDLKEPVRAVAAYLDLLETETDPAARAELLRRAAHANRDLAHLLTSLLEWSRASTAPAAASPVPLGEALENPACRVQFEHLAQERGARLEVAPGLPTVRGSLPLLCQVFANLVTNAIRHNPDPAPRVRVHELPSDEAGTAHVAVDDDGPGFPPALLGARRPRTPAGGGGFGLAIVDRAVERLGGELRLENLPGGGGRARVALPRADASTGRPEA